MNIFCRFFALVLSAFTVLMVTTLASASERPEYVDRCLMSVTATTGLTPQQEAYRKVQCYEGTRGLVDWCEKSVGATMRLDSNSEQHYRNQCSRVTPT